MLNSIINRKKRCWMRKILFSFVILFLFFQNFNLNSNITFSRQDSKIRVNNNSKLNIGNTISGWTGTLEKRPGANIAGQNISFDEGILLTETNESLVTGVFNVTGPDSIELNGNGRFDGQPGTVIHELKVRNQNNRLEGQPLFSSQINFFDASTGLTVALQSKLNQTINLNGGYLRLEDDLHMADETLLAGTGTVNLNKRLLDLPGKESTWSSILNFENALEIALNSKTNLTSKWSFDGDTLINGNGNILDVSGGGQLELKAGSSLYLVDLYLKGVSNTTFVFVSDNVTVYMSNVDVELAGNITMHLGGVYVEGSTTFLLKTFDWTFDTSATLTIDGTTLWLDTRIENPGELRISNPLFVDHAWQPGNDTLGMLSHNFSVLNTGTVREFNGTGASGGGTGETCPCTNLYNAPLTADIDLQCSCLIHPSKTIRIEDDLTIDGHGATLYFCDPIQSQFVVLPGKTVKLKNIQFARLHANTFDLRAYRDIVGNVVVDGKIEVDENVEWDLAENITFSQGRIILTNIDPDTANVFYVRGLAGKKSFIVAPNMTMYDDFGAIVTDKNLVNTGQNTAAFQEIELKGLDYIKTEVGVTYIGAIGLVGGAVVNIGNIDATYTATELEPCDKVFVIEGLENKFALLKDNIYFNGSLSFADFGDSAIHFDFILRERLSNAVVGGLPKVNFATDFVQLYSAYGHARMYFDDGQVLLNNDINAFLVYENSFLDLNRLIVSGDPIWDLYDPLFGGTPFVIEGDSLESQDIPTPVVTEFSTLYLDRLKTKALNLRPVRPKTGLGLVYEKQVEKYLENLEKLNKNNANKNKQANNLQNNLLTRRIDIPAIAEHYFPDDIKVTRISNLSEDMGLPAGSYLIQDGTLTNFNIDPANNVNILMASNATIEQDYTKEVTVSTGDTIAVAGDNNTIIIKNKFNFLGTLQFFEESELTFIFDDSLYKNLVLFMNPVDLLNIPSGSRLIFKGNGTVVFANGLEIKLSDPTVLGSTRATISFNDSCKMKVEDSGTIHFYGYANFIADTGAHIDIDEGQQVIVGDTILDDFNIVFDRSAALQLGTRIPCGDASHSFIKALFSIQKTAVSLDFEQGAQLNIRGDGIFEVNALNGVESSGNLKSFYFDNDGLLSMENESRMRIGRNLGSPEYTIDWDNWNGRIVNDCICMVEYVTAVVGGGFAGILQKNYFVQEDIRSDNLVCKLINLVPSLSVSTVFYDEDGNKKLRLKNGLIVLLNINDQIYADNSVTGIVYGINRGTQFIINLSGQRI
ncbi:MAG: hypothetical protein SZ59_C0001G0199 [candidate division TM6 bacterium GW2011_GWF2_28_16]|nr:MAG: hypothetical protein SZ59_C0001G0199 [candidate division TM6 bacterium GW2011_GWF2_28_16]